MTSLACPVCGSARVERYPTPFADPLVRCRECGARFVHPAPSEAALRDRYEREHGSGKWRSLFEASDAAEVRRRARLLGDLLPGGARGRRLLDVGCGDGRFLDAAAGAGWTTAGTELSWEAARAVAPRHPVVVGSLDALGPGPRFAAITFWDVLEHLPDPAAALRAAAVLLEPDGLIALSLPNAAGTGALVSGSRWRYHDVAAYGHLVHVGPRQVGRLLSRCGLATLHAETRGSVDLRDLMGEGAGGAHGPLTWLADRASGVLARLAEPALRGNTLLVVARCVDPPPAPPVA